MFHNFIRQWKGARNFLLVVLEKFVFFESKKIFISVPLQDKNLILSGMLGGYMGHHMQQTEKF